jgi:hypothetical protein
MNTKRETVGKIATDLLTKQPETQDPIELERAMHRDYERNITECIERGRKDFFDAKQFYIVVDTKKERLLNNVIRNYFYIRRSCPTPNYDQTVYQYTVSDDRITFLWTLPARDICEMFKQNILEIHPDERELLHFVLDFYDGNLDKRCKLLNGEVK